MILGIDAIDIRGGGIEHIKNILIKRNNKFDKIIIWGNKEVLKNIRNNNRIIKIYNPIFDKNLLIRIFWKYFYFKNSIKLNKINCMFYLSGFFLRKVTTSVTLYQNILPLDTMYHDEFNYLSKIKFILQKKLFLITAKKSNFIIFPSNHIKKKFLKYENSIKYKSTIIYHGGNKKFTNKNKTKKLVSVYPASLKKFKNHYKLIKAMSLIKDKKNISLDFFGPANRTEKTKINNVIYSFQNLKNIVTYKGSKAHNYIFKNYNLLIYPSKCESFGLPLVEAALSGIKIVCSNIPIFREILGSYPIYFNPNSVKSILNSIQKIKQKNNTKIQIIKLQNKYNWSRCSQKTLDLIYKVARNEKNKKYSANFK
ncbi:glycosyltransferase [Pelagibacterales bacterium SAG-MED35]|nr:glycosyltransferase [Pelagibacterales bacterium SAG-MED35]